MDEETSLALLGLAGLVELATPDLRIERNGPDRDLVLGWVLWPGVSFPLTDQATFWPMFHPFLEPQWLPRRRAGRLVYGARFSVWYTGVDHGFLPALDLDGFGVTGRGGRGGGVGVGLRVGSSVASVGVVYRSTWTGTGRREDLSLDVQLAWPLVIFSHY
jgi:hypothetical protein